MSRPFNINFLAVYNSLSLRHRAIIQQLTRLSLNPHLPWGMAWKNYAQRKIHLDVSTDLNLQRFNRLQALEAVRPKQAGHKQIFVFFSFLLFIVVCYPFVEVNKLVILTSVLLLHEMGHYLAMRHLGYQNTSIFFLPYLGALVTGTKKRTSILEQIVVLLAGPLPGLTLGLVLFFQQPWLPDYSGDTWLYSISTTLIGLNFFNLLPIYPLDGGQIVHALLFSRFPWANVLSKFLAVAALAILSRINLVIGILALLVAWTIPDSIREAKLHHSLQRQHHETALPSQTYLAAIFSNLETLGYDRLSEVQYYRLAQTQWERYSQPPAAWYTYSALGLSYVACLFSPLIALWLHHKY